MKMSGGYRKQVVTVADATSAGRIPLWEEGIGRMDEGKAYRLTDIVVHC